MPSTRTSRERPAERRLVRSTNERWLAGVCGGLAHYFGILWIFLPEEPT